ncbi:MAG: M23 family metallopeptidase, partial [bacterium]|nr:M23 family metallopeptidase [bacterium]
MLIFLIASFYITPQKVNVGDIFRIWITSNKANVKAVFIEDTISFIKRDTVFVGFGVVPYKTEPGNYWIKVPSEAGLDSVSLSVLPTEFRAETLIVADTMVKYTPTIAKRITKERKNTAEILSMVRPYILFDFDKEFTSPLSDVTISSSYGVKRIMNGTERGFHTGVDFKSKRGDEIRACNDGIVVLAQHHYLSGKCGIIDHGLGIHTYYAHLDSILVMEGDTLK